MFFNKKDPLTISLDLDNNNVKEKEKENKRKTENEFFNENMFFKNIYGREKMLRNSNPELVPLSKKLIIKNLLGKFFSEQEIIIDPHGLNMLSTLKKDGIIYFGEKINDVIKSFKINYLGK
jgi:hypothetical protein